MSTQHQHDELVKNIAVELSILLLEVWKANLTDYYLDTLHAPNGDKLYIEIARGRVHTSAGPPEGCTRHRTSPEKISSSATRTPEAIARDITNRLIPAARVYWKECRDEQQRHDVKMLDIQNACNQLAAYGMKRYQHSRQDEERAQLYRQNVDIDLYGTAEIYEMKISKITLAKAMQILAILSTIETGDSHNDHI